RSASWNRRPSSLSPLETFHTGDCCWPCRPCWRWDCCETARRLYALPQGYYGLSSILLRLAMMALARGEWGNLLGLDRIPEVRTLRSKLAILNREKGRAARWNTELAKPWMGLA